MSGVVDQTIERSTREWAAAVEDLTAHQREIAQLHFIAAAGQIEAEPLDLDDPAALVVRCAQLRVAFGAAVAHAQALR